MLNLDIFCLSQQPVLGKLVQRTAKLDKWLARDLKLMAEPAQLYDTVTGKTMCTYDFYEGKKIRPQAINSKANIHAFILEPRELLGDPLFRRLLSIMRRLSTWASQVSKRSPHTFTERAWYFEYFENPFPNE